MESATQTTQKEATTDSSIMETRARLLIIQYNFDKKIIILKGRIVRRGRPVCAGKAVRMHVANLSVPWDRPGAFRMASSAV